ncbi:MAG: hypothetical protein QOK42_164 [Frankiaceae bacterium]|jgi:hypothetical protein|nr:hypothetical protein [Frankiaceae bacterium]
MKRVVAAALAAALGLTLLSACAGPQAKVTISGKQVPLSVAFGKPKLTVSKPPTVLVPAPSGVGVIEVPVDGPTAPPLPKPTVSFPPTPQTCPTPPPGSSSVEAAPNSARGVPKSTGSLLRVERSTTDARGTITTKDAGIMATSQAAASPGGTTTFQLYLSMFGATSVTEYETVPPSFGGPAQANTGLISIRYVNGDGGLGYKQSFRPTTPLQVFSQPAYSGATWTSTSSDPLNGSVAQVSGQVLAEEPVLACGTIIDTWRANTVVHVTNPDQDIVTTVSTWFATQYGGVPVQQTQSYKGTAGGEAVSGTTKWTVSYDAWSK